MKLKRIEHVQLAMPAGQEDLARHFYAETLGMTEVAKPDNLAKRGGCWFVSGEVHVHLGVEVDFRPARKAHPAFVVDDLKDLQAHLNAAGFPCKGDEPLDGYHRVYVSDPFGNRIELMEII